MFLGHEKDIVHDCWKDNNAHIMLHIDACVENKDDVITDIMWTLGLRGAF